MNETVIKFGFCVPILANPGMTFFRTPSYEKLDWKLIQETGVNCEEKEYDSVFVADHLFLGNRGEIWECLTTMSALAAVTKKISIIPIHLCNNFRVPSVTAKSLATLSHIADGRIETTTAGERPNLKPTVWSLEALKKSVLNVWERELR